MSYERNYRKQHKTAEWPFSVISYDRTPDLSPVEKQALAIWKKHQESSGERSKAQDNVVTQRLERLILPIEDALNHAGYNYSDRCYTRACCLLLLNEMHRRQVSYWAWDAADWITIASKTKTEFSHVHHHFHILHHTANTHFRQCVLVCAYLVGEIPIYQQVTGYVARTAAQRMFGYEVVQQAIQTIQSEKRRIGRGVASLENSIESVLCQALLYNRNPDIRTLTQTVFEQVAASVVHMPWSRRATVVITEALYQLGILQRPLQAGRARIPVEVGKEDTLSEQWTAYINRWYATSTLSSATRDNVRVLVAKAGRWADASFPNASSPDQWTHDTAIAYVATVMRLTVGEWIHPHTKLAKHQIGKPLTPAFKSHLLNALRRFFHDCQEWEWFPNMFKPSRYLATPKSISRLLAPDPRVIADDVWAKLLSAGLSITAADLSISPFERRQTAKTFAFYPLEMVRAIIIVWLFTGLRSDEIRRLRVGCTRSHTAPEEKVTELVDSRRQVCLLHVPVNKTSNAFVKPVDSLVGTVIETWEKVRPAVAAQWDAKTGEEVQYLFLWRGRPIGTTYINRTLIPLLCRKAGIPETDTRGQITSHRARSTIATQLYNAREPMNLFELQEWLGHSSPSATQYYAKITPTKLTKAYTDAGYFARNTRLIDILVDQEVIQNGAAAAGEPWRYFDLGHGYCTYDFFDQCPHRMACAKCSFYQPKDSTYVQLLEAKQNLLRLHQAIPLSEDEKAAVEDGLTALERLTTRLQDVPTPQGLTPRELKVVK